MLQYCSDAPARKPFYGKKFEQKLDDAIEIVEAKDRPLMYVWIGKKPFHKVIEVVDRYKENYPHIVFNPISDCNDMMNPFCGIAVGLRTTFAALGRDSPAVA